MKDARTEGAFGNERSGRSAFPIALRGFAQCREGGHGIRIA